MSGQAQLHHGARPPEAGDLVGRVYHRFIADGFAGRFSAAGAETHVIGKTPLAGPFKRRLFAWKVGRELALIA